MKEFNPDFDVACICSRTQMMLSQCCDFIVSSWVCHFLSFAFLILHCFGLVLVINHATVRPELWRSVLRQIY